MTEQEVLENLKKEFQFFATPPDLADYLVSKAIPKSWTADTLKGNKINILEPSAGDGAIVKAIRRRLGSDKVLVFTYELNPLNRKKLADLGNLVIGENFMEGAAHGMLYDRIIANPPFSKNQDIDHIKMMIKCLKPGGIIVTIASLHWTHSETKKCKDFKELLESLNAKALKLDAGTFKSSGTNVPTCILKIRKPIN